MKASSSRPKAYLSWSSGKDAAYALLEARRLGVAEVVGVLTTVNQNFDRVAMHGVRSALLERQVEALGLDPLRIPIPSPCSNQVYEERMTSATAELCARGVTHIVFGDLFLADIRAYREAQLARAGMQALFPLWGRNTHELASDMLAAGFEARLVCVDPKQLDRSFAGRRFDRRLLGDLPPGVDPCGENGEFHTCVSAGPMFSSPIATIPGPVVERDGFVFADLLPA